MKPRLLLTEDRCELCGKAPSIEFFRKAGKGEAFHTVLNVCQDCIAKFMERGKRDAVKETTEYSAQA